MLGYVVDRLDIVALENRRVVLHSDVKNMIHVKNLFIEQRGHRKEFEY